MAKVVLPGIKQYKQDLRDISTEVSTVVQNLQKLSQIKPPRIGGSGTSSTTGGNTPAKISDQQKAVNSLNKQIKLLNDTEVNSLKLTKQRTTAEKNLATALSKEGKEVLALRTKTTQLNAATRKQTKDTLALDSAYKKLEVKYAKLNKLAQEAGAKFGAQSKQFKRASIAALRYRTRLDSIDKVLKNGTRNVGRYNTALGRTRKLFSGLVGALGVTSGIFAFVQIMRNTIGVLKDFEKQNATLSAILQISKEDMVGLKDEAIRLGETTARTASEVTTLQIAYARLGFSMEDIINLSEATVNGSIALNAELGATAELVGAVVNTMDEFSSIDAPEIMDILALSTAKSALNFEKLKTGIPIVAGAANAAGIPFTKLVALMGKLADSGIDVSTSSTSLRNIFIIAASQGLNYSEILQKIKDSQDKLTASNDEFGRRAAVSSAILAQNIDKTNELDEALQRAAGTAQRMADKELDTLDGELKLLNSAWQGIILQTDKANGITDTLKDTIRSLRKNLSVIVGVIVDTVKAWLIYKAILLSVSIITRVYTATTVALRIALIAMNGGLKKATRAMKLFNLTSKANLWLILISVLAGVVSVFIAFRDGATSAARAQRELNEAKEKGIEIGEEISRNIQTEIDKTIELIKEKERLNLAEAKGDNQRSAISLRSKEDQIKALSDEAEKTRLVVVSLTELSQGYDKASPIYARTNAIIKTKIDLYNSLNKQIRNLNIDLKENPKVIKDSVEFLENLISANNKLIKQQNDKGTIKKLQNENKTIQKQIDSLLGIVRIDKEAEKRRRIALQLEKDKLSLQKFVLEQEKLGIEKQLREEERSALGKLKLAEDLALKKQEIAAVQLEKELVGVKEGTDKEKLIQEKHKATLLKIEQDFENDKEKIVGDNGKILQGRIQKELDQKKIAQNNELAELKRSLSKRKASEEETEQAITDLKKKHAKENLEILIRNLEEILKFSTISAEARLAIELKLSELKVKLAEGDTDKTIDKLKEVLEFVGQAVGEIANILNGFTERRIQKLEEERDAIDESFDAQIEASENSQLSEEEREEKKRLLEEERDRKLKEKDKLIAKERTKQAKIDKAAALIQIAISTAIGVSKDFEKGAILGGLTSALTIAMGVLQTAAVLAQPIPKFKMGTKNPLTKDIIGEVGHGKHEVIHEQGKVVEITPKTPTLMHLKKGQEIAPSIPEYLKDYTPFDYDSVMNAAISTSLSIDTNKLNSIQAQKEFNRNLSNEQFKQDIVKSVKSSMKGWSMHNHTDTRHLAETVAEILSDNNFRDNRL